MGLVKSTSLALLFICILALHGEVYANTYYLSSTGDDLNDGLSPISGWETIKRVNDHNIQAGDTILLEGGSTFTGELRFMAPRVGTPTNPIVVSSYGSGRATIDGGDRVSIFIFNGAGIKIKNLNLVGSGLSTNIGVGLYISTDTTDAVFFDYLEFDSMDISGFLWGGVRFDYSGSYSNVRGGFRNVRMTNLEVFDNGDAGINVEGRQFSSGYSHQDFYIAYCRAYRNLGNSGKIWNNTGNGIVVGNTDTVLIENCIAYENGIANSFGGGGPVGIWLWDCRQGVIQFCESHHNQSGTIDGGGFDLDGGCEESVIQYCYSHDNEGAGYLLAAYAGSRKIRNCEIRFNISQNDGRDAGYGALHFWRHSSSSIDGVKVYNNTIYTDYSSGGLNSMVRIASSGINNLSFYNNCFYTKTGVPFIKANNNSQSSLEFSHNAYYSTTNSSIEWNGNTYPSLASWQSATGYEKQNGVSTAIILDPQLNDPGLGSNVNNPAGVNGLENYKLLPGSPLINAGVNLSSIGINPGNIDFHLSPISPSLHNSLGSSISLSVFNLNSIAWGATVLDSGIYVEVHYLDAEVDSLVWVEIQNPDEGFFTSYKGFSKSEIGTNSSFFYSPPGPGRYQIRIRGDRLNGSSWFSEVKSVLWDNISPIDVWLMDGRKWKIAGLTEEVFINRIELVSVDGKVTESLLLNDDFTITCPSHVSPGIYVLKLSLSDRSYMKKIVVSD